MASSLAASARWMKRPIFFISFFSMKFSGSKFLTSAAMVQAKLVVSKCVIWPTPLLPASRFFQTSGAVLPTPQIRPMPVTTTRRSPARAKLLAALRVLLDVIHGVFHGLDLLRALVRDLDIERFFEGHDQFHGVKGIGAQVVHEGGAGGHFTFVHSQLLNDDLLYFVFSGCRHVC